MVSETNVLIFILVGYLSGSLSFAFWITCLFKGVDVRESGSKHATTTNTIRQAGFGPGVLVLVLDITKGFLPIYFGIQANLPDWAIGLVAAATVAGHCWPLFAQFRGGMGLATAGGAVLALSWLAFVVGVGILVTLTLILKHSARASVLTGLSIAPAFLAFGLRGPVIWVGVFGGLVIAARFTVDWQRRYKELWLDRE